MVATLIALGMLIAIWVLRLGGAETLSDLSNPEKLAELVTIAGPMVVVLLLALAVVVSPIPSGPIAMAAGATLGPLVGGTFTAAGAVLGAVIAFSLSRWVGYQPLSASRLRWADWLTRPRDEKTLAAVVLISRLIPFISFDAVSYVAGLTTIRIHTFTLATMLGVLPASFVFAALGAGLASVDSFLIMVFACGLTAILPIGWGMARWVRRHFT